MDFDTLNNLISIVLFSTMVATLIGTLTLYGYYKSREVKAKAKCTQIPVTQTAILQISNSTPSFAVHAPETKKKIRFG